MRIAATAVVLAACSESAFDGLYRVDSFTRSDVSCEGPGEPIPGEFPMFRIRERNFLGVTIYPVYPCDELGACSQDNDVRFNLVTVEEDLDQVSENVAFSAGNTCVLSSIDMVIERVGEAVVPQNRVYQLVLEPYDPATCTLENAESMRDAMECVRLLALVGVIDR